MRLVRAELLKLRRRWMPYVLLIVTLLIMGLATVVSGIVYSENGGLFEFPAAYSLISQFAFGLGGLLAVVLAASFVGADWNWGVVRNVIARGESRTNYLLAKAVALAIVLAVGTLIIFAVGIALIYVTGLVLGVPISNPLRGRGLLDLVDNLALGYPVLLERAAIGLAVAVVMRSQIAGAVIGIVLFLGESILRTVLTIVSFTNSGVENFATGGFQPIGPEWYQYLPISVGDYAINAAPGASLTISGGVDQFLLNPVPLQQALTAVVIYAVVVLAVAILALNRQEIT